MAKKQVIRLTESDLRKVIKESVNKILSERTKSEQDLTDDEVSNRRDINFANEFEPEYGDSIYGDEQERHRNMIHNARIMHHNATQNHKTKMRESFDLDTFNQQRQEYDVNTRDYDCHLYFSEVENIKSSLTRMKVLVNKIQNGENGEMIFNYLYKQIENIKDIMENK